MELLSTLKQYAGNRKTVETKGDTIRIALQSLTKMYPGLNEQLFDTPDHVREFINIFLNGQDIRVLDGFDTKLIEDDKIVIMPAIAGGIE